MKTQAIETTQLSKFRQQRKNANRHTARGIGMLDNAMSQDGYVAPMTATADGEIIDGSARHEVAGARFGDEALVVRHDGTRPLVMVRTDIANADDPRAKRIALAANRIAQVDLDFDGALLTELSQELDLSSLWTQEELQEQIGRLAEVGTLEDVEPQLDKAEELREKYGVVSGQLWALGEHRLLCGDSTRREDVAKVMGGEKADILVNDPPYGMRLDADFSSMKSKPQFALEKKAFGGHTYADTIGDHTDFDASPIVALFSGVKEQFWFGADYYCRTLGDTEHEGAWLVWDKRLDETMDKVYGSCFELLWSRQKHKRDIFRHKWAGIFGMEQEDAKSRVHPNQKPTSLYVDILERYSKVSAIVVDCFSGSGTSLIACEKLNRKCRALEIAPAYVAVTLERYHQATGKTPTLLT